MQNCHMDNLIAAYIRKIINNFSSLQSIIRLIIDYKGNEIIFILLVIKAFLFS